MNTTNTPIPSAAVSAAIEAHAAAAAKARETHHRAIKFEEGRPGHAPGPAREQFEAELAQLRREAEHAAELERKAALAIHVAEASEVASARESERLASAAVAPKHTTSAELDAQHAVNLKVAETTRANWLQLKSELQDLNRQLQGIESERLEIISARGSLEKMGSALTALSGKREALEVKIAQVQDDLRPASTSYAEAVRVVLGAVNTSKAAIDRRAVQAAVALRRSVEINPLVTIQAALQAARNAVDAAPLGSGQYGLAGERYRAALEQLAPVIHRHLSEIEALAADIHGRLTKLENEAEAAVAQLQN